MACIGLDIGTTHSCVGVFHNGKVNILANNQGFRSTPCYVSFFGKDQLVGDAAVEKVHCNMANTVYHFRRAMGKSYDHVKDAAYSKDWSFQLTQDAQGQPLVALSNEEATASKITPEKFCSIMIHALKTLAEDFIGETVQHAVLTVPSHFTRDQRESMTAAATACGLNVLKILDESLAAAIAYDLDLPQESSSVALIYDMGGATHDITLLNVDQGLMTVLATTSGDMIGGENFTNLLVEHCCKTFFKQTKVDIKDNARALGRLKVACEAAKRSLSQQSRINIEVDSLAEGQDLILKVSRSRFEDMIADMVRKSVSEIDQVLEEAGYGPEDVDQVILIGGSVQIPLVKNSIEKFFGNKTALMTLSPDEAVARGATIEANTYAAGLEYDINYDIDVAAVPLSLGVKAANGSVEFLIDRDAVLPARGLATVTTSMNDQDTALIQVYEGERVMAQQNTLLAEIALRNLPKKVKDTIDIEIVFELSKVGDLTIKAKELTSGVSTEYTIEHDSKRLSSKDVAQLVKEAEDAADEDADRLDEVENAAAGNNVVDVPVIEGHDAEMD